MPPVEDPGPAEAERALASLAEDVRATMQGLEGKRGGSVCLNTVRGVSKWLRRPFQAAAGIGVARLMYAWSGTFPPSDECGLLPL